MGTNDKFGYLDLLASIGHAKHIGGANATDTLIEKSGIKEGSTVLDVGCGLGKTSCRLALEGCRVVGVDITPRMVQYSRERASKLDLLGKVNFLRGDARSLPVKSGMFDAVFIESVTVFAGNVDKALNEYDRVLKAGGKVCDNEVCITQASKDELKDRVVELEDVFDAFASRTNRGILTFEDWQRLYIEHFGNVDASHHVIDPQTEMEEKRMEGKKGLIPVLKTLWLYMTNDQARDIIVKSRNMYRFTSHFGYGLFVSTK